MHQATAHEDHVGALPYLLREFNIPVYGTPFTLAPPRFTNNSSFSFSLGGDSGQYYRLEFSTNLTTWLPLATNLAIAGEAAFSDTSISNQPGRFYRVILLP